MFRQTNLTTLEMLPSKTLHHYCVSPLMGSPNKAYMAHFVNLNFGFARTSYMLKLLSGIPDVPKLGIEGENNGI
jgi:hypothetical protein